jgi:hypothetical protein
MDVELSDQNDGLAFAVDIGQIFQDVSVVHRGVAIHLCPVRLKKSDGANPLASGPAHTGHISTQCIDARKKAALGGTAWILLKAAVSPRTRPFPEPAPRRG